jgi:OOP family OmpA-OmpF porin
MNWKTVWVSVMACCYILAWAAGSGAEPKKRRVDLTGRQDLKAEEIIAGLTPVQTRGIKTRGLQPGLATIALTVNFAFDSAEIQSQAIPNLQSLGKALQSPQLAPYQIRIEGHTDSVGTAAYNRALSQRRAESVKQYLTQYFDITPDHLVTAGKGEDEPISDNDSDTGRYKNRRAEFVNLGRR